MIRRFALLLGLLALATPTLARETFTSGRIGVVVQGRGPDVILIPGLNSQPRVWAATVAAVPGYRYHLVHISGFAGRPAGANAVGEVAAPVTEEVARYIQTAGLARPAVVGHSMGGAIGLMLAARHPRLVGRLMVVDMIPNIATLFAGPNAPRERVVAVADQVAAGVRAQAGPARAAAAEATIAGMVATPAERAGPVADSLASESAVTASAMRELLLTDLTPELPRVVAPTTVLYVKPAQPPMTDEQIDAGYRQAYAGLRGVRLVRVPNSAHFVMLDAPDRFRAELSTFLARR